MTQRKRILLNSFAVLLAAASIATAQDFWTKKPFNEWSSEELKRFMTDSPWVKNVVMATQAPVDNSLDMGTGGRGGGGGDTGGDTPAEGGGGGGGRGGRGGARGGGGGGSSVSTMTISVSWQSALPVREANVRSQMNHAGEVPADAKEYLAGGDSDYVILISGMPQSIARAALSNQAKVKKSYIKAGKHEIPVSGIGTAQRGRNMDILMKFSKAEPIRLEDNEVEVDAKLGMFEVKKKFKLKEMVVNGKLQL